MIIFTLNRRLGFLLNRRKGFNALLSLKPRRLFISLHEQRNEAKKFAVCTFWATPALFSAKQKELASLKQLFVFHAPTLTSASRPKSEAGPYRFFFATSLRSLGCDVFFFCFALFLSSRAEQSVVKDLGSIAQPIDISFVGVWCFLF